MFVLLAVAFALGFVIFGVGSGSTGISDALQNAFNFGGFSPLALPIYFRKTLEVFPFSKLAPGALLSYGEVAQRIGKPAAVRAVGAAIGRNPLGIIVPCHRVIGADGALSGYGGGVWRKQRLLDHERAHAPKK